jgi:PIN domain nuclease of toxin-antitoxin system
MAKGVPMILDTCAVIWLAAGGKELSRGTLKRIEEAQNVYISAITGFEIAIKSATGKLKLPNPDHWLHQVTQKHRLEVMPLDLAICIRAAGLPNYHDDPFDRMIIATALQHNLAVVTKDENFEKYGVTVMV